MIRQLFVVLQHWLGGRGKTGANKLKISGWLNNFVTDCRLKRSHFQVTHSIQIRKFLLLQEAVAAPAAFSTVSIQGCKPKATTVTTFINASCDIHT